MYNLEIRESELTLFWKNLQFCFRNNYFASQFKKLFPHVWAAENSFKCLILPVSLGLFSVTRNHPVKGVRSSCSLVARFFYLTKWD